MTPTLQPPLQAPLARCSGHFAAESPQRPLPDPASAFAPALVPPAFAPANSRNALTVKHSAFAPASANPDEYYGSAFFQSVNRLEDAFCRLAYPLTRREDETGQLARMFRNVLWEIADEGDARGLTAARRLASEMRLEAMAMIERIERAAVALTGRELAYAGTDEFRDLLSEPDEAPRRPVATAFAS